ncbi:BON1-associated protein 2-like, partial [Triticum dicoccoides]|uniref:BON1-associated protein 2-like n=1 Tax=Triticum dicoccoides TaxID=85692 RepID=UPI001890D0C1
HKVALLPMTTLEVTVLSAEEVVLKELLRRPLDRGAYAVVHMERPDGTLYTDKPTPRTGINDEDGDCNGYPYWGEAVRVTLPAGVPAIHVVICRWTDSVAAARVPVADFSVGPPGHLHCLSYRLLDTESVTKRRNGIVNITVKRLDGAQAKGKGGKDVEEAASGTGYSCCGGVAEEGKVSIAAATAAAPAGAVIGYPVEFYAAGQANGKGSV